MKKLVALVIAFIMLMSVASAYAATVGVAMPTQSLQRWNQDGANMKAKLEEAGYEVDLQYADNDVAKQVSQIENMIANGVDILVVASIDGGALGTVLADAKAMEIPVIAYDRLIMQTDAVSYYATFDNYMVGTIQGQYVIDNLDLENAEGPFNIEFIAGAPDDNNARYFFQGAWDTVKPYIDNGKLVCVSGQTDFETIATQSWSTEKAQQRMENIISSNYTGDTKLDVVLCSNDSTANGATNGLLGAGFQPGEGWPIITGQDCDIVSVKNMLAGTQSMSVFKDTRTLANKVVEMVDAILKGEQPEVNDTETYDNGTGIIPTYLCAPVFADLSNYKELLLDSGYYTSEQLGIK
ncbi:MAG: sugar ABC transporter substrate-binding protein [Christensenellaceae bacterium]|nr:sugar ABC transporter substrate-binding protein [Christensenellaceae bacterium]